MKDKKGQETGSAMLALFIIGILFFAWLSIHSKIDPQNPIGKIQYKLINTYDNAENIMFYIDEAARYSAYSSINTLAEKGGLYAEDCGTYFGAKLLLNKTKDCIPTDSKVNENLEKYFIFNFSSYLSLFPHNIHSNYNVDVKEEKSKTTISGKTDEPMVIPVTGKEFTEIKEPTTYYSTDYFQSPVSTNKVTSCFGYRGPNIGSKDTHEGIDFSAKLGDAVYSVADGTVAYTDPDGWGRVVIDHGNGLKSAFVHLDSITVTKNEQVKRGDTIGTAGERGPSGRYQYKNVHLHFELISNKADTSIKDPATGANIAYKNGYQDKLGDVINPMCFFDTSKLTIKKEDWDPDKSCKCVSQNNCVSENPELKFCGLYGISMPKQEESQAQQTTQQSSSTVDLTSGVVSCQNADMSKIDATNLKACENYKSEFSKFLSDNKDKLGFDDLLLLYSWAFQESSCNHQKTGGILKVDACNDCGQKSVDYQLEKSLEVFLENKEPLDKRSGLSDNYKIVLSFFAYNRGPSALRYALGYLDKGYFLIDAMTRGCKDKFGDEKDKADNPKCNHYGYAARYPEKIFDIYKEACEKTGGTATVKDYTSSTNIVDSVGEYSFTPAFKVDVDYDIGIYSRIYTAIQNFYNPKTSVNELIEKIEENPQVLGAVGGAWMVSSDCDEENERAFYSFAEGYSLCANSTESNPCYCEVNIPKTISKDSEFEIKMDGENTIFKAKGLTDEVIIGKKPAYNSVPNDNIVVVVKNENGKYSLEIANQEYNDIDITKFILYKTNDMISFLDDKIYPSIYDKYIKNDSTIRKCPISKETIKLCVKTGKNIPYFDPESNTIVDTKENIIKFAYHFRDVLAPPTVLGIIFYKEKMPLQNEAIISWSHEDKDFDTAKFNIYYSKVHFRDWPKDQIIDSPDIIKLELPFQNMRMVDFVDLSKPSAKPLQIAGTVTSIEFYYNTIFYDQNNNPSYIKFPETEQLYYFANDDPDSITDTYFTRLSFNSKEKYYVMITSIDNHNNEEMKDSTDNNYLILEPVDNIPPATRLLEGFDFYLQKNEAEGKARVFWIGKPTKNIDGSDFDADNEDFGLLGYDIYFREEGLDLDYVIKDSALPRAEADKTETKIQVLDFSKKLCFYVVPVDKAGNKQFSEKTEEMVGRDILKKVFEPKCLEPPTFPG